MRVTPNPADISHMSMRPASRQALRSRATRDQIVQAALGIFALKGYAAASMDDICLAAGCSKGGLYHHFPTKAHVLAGVVKRLIELKAILPPLDAAAAITGVPATGLGRVLIEIWAEASRSAEIREQLRQGYQAAFDEGLAYGDGALGAVLRIGTLIQMLTRESAIDADDAARRLGIRPAA